MDAVGARSKRFMRINTGGATGLSALAAAHSHILAGACDLVLVAGADKVAVNGQTAIYTGQYGVDLHCYIAEPTSFVPHTRLLGHNNGFGFAKYYQEKFGKPFREDQTQLRIPQAKRDGGYFVAIVPVKQGEPAPQFATVAGGNAIQVKFPDRTDTILLQKDAAEVVTDQGGKKTVTDLTGGNGASHQN